MTLGDELMTSLMTSGMGGCLSVLGCLDLIRGVSVNRCSCLWRRGAGVSVLRGGVRLRRSGGLGAGCIVRGSFVDYVSRSTEFIALDC
jgi:hypothetical protein